MGKLIIEPLFYIYFIYGLSFLLMSFLIFYGIKRATSLTFVSTFSMLAFFGLTHGMTEWIFWVQLMLQTMGSGKVGILTYLSQIFLVVSFVFLLQFGINLLTYQWEKKGFVRAIPLVLFVIYLAAIFAAGVTDVLQAGLIGRYGFGFTGAALSAIVIFRLSNTVKPLGNRKLARGLTVAAVGFACYAIFGGLIINPVLGLPVQLFRAACAFTIAISFFNVLDVFKARH
jgi:hypothetical protein